MENPSLQDALNKSQDVLRKDAAKGHFTDLPQTEEQELNTVELLVFANTMGGLAAASVPLDKRIKAAMQSAAAAKIAWHNRDRANFRA